MSTGRPRAQTPSQTVGPFFNLKLRSSNVLADATTAGPRIRIEGRVLDGDGVPVDDALIELWQADREGRYGPPPSPRTDSPFVGFGRAESATGTGAFVFETIKPGAIPDRDDVHAAPHLNLIVFARGLLNHLFTRVYFSDETARNATDPVLQLVPPGRRATLLAAASGPDRFRLDIILQGPGETAFLDA